MLNLSPMDKRLSPASSSQLGVLLISCMTRIRIRPGNKPSSSLYRNNGEQYANLLNHSSAPRPTMFKSVIVTPTSLTHSHSGPIRGIDDASLSSDEDVCVCVCVCLSSSYTCDMGWVAWHTWPQPTRSCTIANNTSFLGSHSTTSWHSESLVCW